MSCADPPLKKKQKKRENTENVIYSPIVTAIGVKDEEEVVEEKEEKEVISEKEDETKNKKIDNPIINVQYPILLDNNNNTDVVKLPKKYDPSTYSTEKYEVAKNLIFQICNVEFINASGNKFIKKQLVLSRIGKTSGKPFNFYIDLYHIEPSANVLNAIVGKK